MVIVVIVGIPKSVIAQSKTEHKIDSFTRLITASKSDTERIKLECDATKLYPDYDPNKGLELARKAYNESQKLGWTRGIILANISMGLNDHSKADYPNAIKEFETVRTLSLEEGYRNWFGIATKYCGECYYDENNYADALKYFFEALQTDEEIHNTKETFVVLEFIGRVYEAQKNYDKALVYYKMSYDSALHAGAENATAKNLVNIGQVYHLMGKSDEALDCFNRSQVIFRQLNDDGGMGITLANLGSVYNDMHKYGAALNCTWGALHIYEPYNDRQNIASIYEAIGKIYFSIATSPSRDELPDSLSNKDLVMKRAFAYFFHSIAICRDLSYLEGIYVTSADVSKAYEATGAYKDALAYYKQFIAIRDSVFSAENSLKIANLEIAREVSVKDRELMLERIKSQKSRNENIFFVSGIVLLLTILLILYRNFAVQKTLNAKITELVNEQEKTIATRTSALTESNTRLLHLIQFNVHQVREPMTRILGLMGLRKEVGDVEFTDQCLPMLEQSVKDLDKTMQEVVKNAEKNN